MTTAAPRTHLSWSARLLIALCLVLLGAAAAAWALARYDGAARFLGVAPSQPKISRMQPAFAPQELAPVAAAPSAADQARIATLEARIAGLENATRQVAGSAVRADALLVAFAARRAIERGVALGYLETLLVDRFGPEHPGAVATIVTAARAPVRLNQLIAEYEALGPELRAAGPEEGWWDGVRREMGSLVEIRRADRPSVKPDARYQRALSRLSAGEVDTALAETMRLPGAAEAGPWIRRARHYVATRRALDQIESSALLAGDPPAA
ncbi:hypothetical protein [Sphingomonas sp.]|uniref:hypothetical protein n=1 Tax=Sphingomonas sp. TaxID=28214 RepID=UPI00286DAA5B|nr:hypothetical protein [Sphingomonas sp.]